MRARIFRDSKLAPSFGSRYDEDFEEKNSVSICSQDFPRSSIKSIRRNSVASVNFGGKAFPSQWSPSAPRLAEKTFAESWHLCASYIKSKL